MVNYNRFLRVWVYNNVKYLGLSKLMFKANESMKIEFETSATVTGAVGEMNLTITGLKPETMYQIASDYNFFLRQNKYNKIIVEAGYKGNYTTIFEGNITEAVPNIDKADYSLRIKACSWYETMVRNTSTIAKDQVSVKWLLREIALKNKLRFVDDLDEDVHFDYFAQDCNLIEHIRRISEMAGIDCWVERDRLYAKKRGTALSNYRTLFVNASNMIGSPEPTPFGCTVKVRMDTSLVTGMRVKIQSSKFTQLNSNDYAIMTIQHAGETYGSKWQTTLKLVRTDLYSEVYNVKNIVNFIGGLING